MKRTSFAMNPHESRPQKIAYVKPTPGLETGTPFITREGQRRPSSRGTTPTLAQPRFGGGVIRQARRLTVAFREGDEPTLRAVFMHVTTAAPLELMPGTPPPVTPRFSFVSTL